MPTISPRTTANQSQFDTLPGIIAWFGTKIGLAYQKLKAFQRCEACKDTNENCRTCSWKRENLQTDVEGYVEMQAQEIWWLLGSGQDTCIHYRDFDAYYESFDKLEYWWKTEEESSDKKMAGCYSHTGDIDPISKDYMKGVWHRKCAISLREHELGVARGWAWNGEGNAKEAGRAMYDASKKIDDWEDKDWLAKHIACSSS
ncbi:hypothetical protein BDZ45DRAFT_48753 [Acephala macrosclerotiorum]|nr:hypothetical protein BDZ45DRAFT_48753 [Acephala macrosclerotiorum]